MKWDNFGGGGFLSGFGFCLYWNKEGNIKLVNIIYYLLWMNYSGCGMIFMEFLIIKGLIS